MEKNFWEITEKKLRQFTFKESQANYARRVFAVSRQRYNAMKGENRKPGLIHLIRLIQAGLNKTELIHALWDCYHATFGAPIESKPRSIVQRIGRNNRGSQALRHTRKKPKKSSA